MSELDDLKKNGFSLDDLENLRMKLISEGADANEKDLKEIEKLKSSIQNSASVDSEGMRKMLAVNRVSELIGELIGDRSIRKTAADSGVAASYISGIIKKKYLPSAEILRKLSSPEANPQNGIRLLDLMKAAGYFSSDYSEDSMMVDYSVNVADMRSGDDKQMLIECKTSPKIEAKGMRYDAISKGRSRSMIVGLIYGALSEKRIMFSSVQNVDWKALRIADMAIHVSQKPIFEWWFDFEYLKYVPDYLNENQDDFHRKAHRIIRSQIVELLFLEPRSDRKVSIVVDNLQIFKWAQRLEGKLSYRGDLSMILIDNNSLSIAAEVYLAHYSDQDISSEFYIV